LEIEIKKKTLQRQLAVHTAHRSVIDTARVIPSARVIPLRAKFLFFHQHFRLSQSIRLYLPYAMGCTAHISTKTSTLDMGKYLNILVWNRIEWNRVHRSMKSSSLHMRTYLMGYTARSVEYEPRNDRRNANRDPEWCGDFSQLVESEKLEFIGISRDKFKARL